MPRRVFPQASTAGGQQFLGPQRPDVLRVVDFEWSSEIRRRVRSYPDVHCMTITVDFSSWILMLLVKVTCKGTLSGTYQIDLHLISWKWEKSDLYLLPAVIHSWNSTWIQHAIFRARSPYLPT